MLVLDLGCGDGSWIIDTAQCWKNTQFYGLDLQCIHPPHSQLVAEIGEHANNIHFKYYNFLLDKLPYLDGKFDMVRMANLKWAIPADMVRLLGLKLFSD
jgi:SAM-dependent methyltransferase